MSRMVAIGDCVEPCQTWNPTATAPDVSFRYIDLSSVDRELTRITRADAVSGSSAPSRARQLVKAGDVLVSTVRPNLNGVAIVPVELDGATASTGFIVLRPREGKIDRSYLFHWVKHPRFVNDMVRKATGASYPAVSNRIVRESLLPLPTLPEQRRIATILDKADALRAKRREVIAKLDELVQSVFLDMFGDPATNPKGWGTATFGEILKVKSGNGLTAQSMTLGGEFPVYGGNGISGYHDEYMFDEPQLVIGRVGVYCGVVHLTKPKSWVTDNALYVSSLLKPIDQTFLKAILIAANFNQYAGQAAQPLVSGSRIYPVGTILPPISLQREYAAFAQGIDQQKRKLKQHAGQQDLLFASLQHRAFSGTL